MASTWVTTVRDQIKEHRGLTVTNDRGRVRVQCRRRGLPTQSVSLAEYEWEISKTTDVVLRIGVIAKAMEAGHDLKSAARIATRASTAVVEDWDAALEAYRDGPQQALKPQTWAYHQKVIDLALEALASRRPPTNGADLIDLVLKQWPSGTRQYQSMRQRIQKFLRFCVERRQFKSSWLPPEGQAPAKTKTKRIGYPLSDAQVLRILEALPDTTIGRRYRFAIQLMATYGLRPADLRYLQVRNNGTELWSGYEKSKGGTQGATTEPRRLFALKVLDLDGTPQEWNLLQRVALGEELPPLGDLSETGQRMYVYLKSKPVWKSIQAEAQREGQQAVVYSFRHRYAYVAHTRPMANGQMRSPKQCADAMGHDLDTHLKSYARFQTRDLAAAFDEGESSTCARVHV
ncbi:hypothetical protein MITS9509_01368 [Synechococcus sp. MIT S9509]|uniref:integrase n=1 Tax=Synechococcus sp. MIT S9509 TaxID=1801630 RepID=UPI0007BB4D7B|nr:integrase [Synechococcus sp. MIT S9509]KZR92381.1 hypothetical protein MITS9509_01368 [Synechococcus sp. MIT S9509]